MFSPYLQSLLFVLLATCLKSTAEVSSKLAGLSSHGEPFMYILFNPWCVLALIALVLQAASWTAALRNCPVSIAYPMMSLSLVIGMSASYFLFGEEFSLLEIIGTICILVGVVAISYPRPNGESS
ncbi:MAG: EamA family transporter [Bdellovibrionales bacterium]|nr:EamA family transporter [Bdellovibrionales bacterium]